MPRPPQTPTEGGFIIEFTQYGGHLKVTAIDPETMTEVSMIGVPSVGRDQLSRLAIRKLRYVLAKRGE